MGANRYERFSEAEYARRHAALDEVASAHEADAIVVYGTGGAPAPVQYLTGFAPHRDTYACFAPGTEPTLLVQLFNHVPTARAMSVLADVAWGGPDSVASLVEALTRLPRLRRVGVIGPVPHTQMSRLQAELADVDMVDLSSEFTGQRLRKSEEEIGWARRGAALTDDAMRAFARACRPGATEFDLGSAFEVAVRHGGGQPGICFLTSRPMRGAGTYVPAQQWSGRVLEPGDMVIVEMSSGYGGYTGQALRTIIVDAAPTGDIRKLHEVATEAFDAIVAAIRPGARASDLLEAARIIDAAGYTVCDDVVHGYVGGYLPPVLRTPATQHQPYRNLELAPGMCLVVQPNVISLDHTVGVQTGELVVVTEDGYENLHDLPDGIVSSG